MSVGFVDRLASIAAMRVPLHPVDVVPEGHMVSLPGRGCTFVTDSLATESKLSESGSTADSTADELPTIILLHSVMTTGLLAWYPVIAELSTHMRVITLDQRWHGRGIASPEFSLDDCAHDTVALADVLGIDRFMVAGFSMGGGIAQLIAHHYPERVTGLVLAAVGPFFGSKTTGRPHIDHLIDSATRHLGNLVPPVTSDQLDERGLTDGAWVLRQFRSCRLSQLDALSAGLAAFDSRPWLGDISAPTAVCVTTKDRVVPPARQHLLLDGIADAIRVEVPAGHACCTLEPHAFVPPFIDACRRVQAAYTESAHAHGHKPSNSAT